MDLPFADAAELARCLEALCGAPAESRGQILGRLRSALRTGTIRDLEPHDGVFAELFALLERAWASFEPEHAVQVHELVSGLLALPEFDDAARTAAPPASMLDAAFERLALPAAADGAPGPAPQAVSCGVAGRADMPAGVATACAPGTAQTVELGALRSLIYCLYKNLPSARGALRLRLGAATMRMGGGNAQPPPGLRTALELLGAIISGFGAPTAAHAGLLRDVLMPLHRSRAPKSHPELHLPASPCR